MKLLYVAGGLLIAGSLTAGALSGCGTSHPAGAAACKSAMAAGYAHALAHPSAPAATEPAACRGVPAATVRRFVAEIAASAQAPVASTTPASAPAGVTAAEIAAQLGATGVQAQQLVAGGAEASSALGYYQGQYVTVTTFATAAARSRWEAAGPNVAVINGAAPDGTLYAVMGTS